MFQLSNNKLETSFLSWCRPPRSEESMNAACSFNLPSAITVAPIKDCHKAPPFLKFCELLGNFPHRNVLTFLLLQKKIKTKH